MMYNNCLSDNVENIVVESSHRTKNALVCIEHLKKAGFFNNDKLKIIFDLLKNEEFFKNKLTSMDIVDEKYIQLVFDNECCSDCDPMKLYPIISKYIQTLFIESKEELKQYYEYESDIDFVISNSVLACTLIRSEKNTIKIVF